MSPASTGKGTGEAGIFNVLPGIKWILENLSANRLKSSDSNWFAKCLSRENLRAGLPSFELFLHFLSLLLFFLELVLSHKTGNSKNLIWLLNTDLLKKRMQLRSKEAKGQPLVRFSTFSGERFKLSPAANVRVEWLNPRKQIHTFSRRTSSSAGAPLSRVWPSFGRWTPWVLPLGSPAMSKLVSSTRLP